MADELGIPNDATVMRLARCPEVFTMEQVPEDEEHMWQILETGDRRGGREICRDTHTRG